ncbi:MAG: HvfC/BufC N-terminal domain-containing protein [Chromatiales bacterium]
MPSLREVQFAFAEAVFHGRDTPLGEQIRANGLSGARRLQIYRNNVFASLTSALRAVYPVVERLVGEGFFRYAAHEYIRRHPSTSGNLHDFGTALPAFLSSFETAATLPYLPDMARLEWAYHQVFHALEHAPFNLGALGTIRPEHYPALRFKLHPASWLVASDYPVLRIWQVNQDNYAGDQRVDLAEGGVRVLVIRQNLEVQMQPLGEGEYALLRALAAGDALAQAYEKALAVQADFDLIACLKQHVSRGTLVDSFL